MTAPILPRSPLSGKRRPAVGWWSQTSCLLVTPMGTPPFDTPRAAPGSDPGACRRAKRRSVERRLNGPDQPLSQPANDARADDETPIRVTVPPSDRVRIVSGPLWAAV